MKELSTDHETARKQVWLREKERTFDFEMTHPESYGVSRFADVDKIANESADKLLADFDKRFPMDSYAPARNQIPFGKTGLDDLEKIRLQINETNEK